MTLASPRAGGRVPIGAGSRTGARSDRVRFRRSLTLMLMTLLLPGSAQLAAGNRRIGRLAIRIWAVLVAALLLLILVGLTWRSELIRLFTDTSWLLALRIVLSAAAVGWVVLFVDAWRLGEPLGLTRAHRAAMAGINTALCFVSAGALLLSAHIVAVQRDFITSVFGSQTVSQAVKGRYNVLLLGGDSGPTRVGMRPDSITLASIDAATGRTVLIGLPRNLMNAPFPAGSAMAKRFPHGFNCATCELNAINTWATEHRSVFPSTVKDPGIYATEQAVKQITGLKVNYYAMVNLGGFQQLVDALGGVTIRVPTPIPIGGIGHAITGYIPAGVHHLDGFQTLWFARSRVATDDYYRMARQKCVMNAMLHQLSPETVVLKSQDIAKAGKSILRTDIPASQLATFIDLALKARSQPVSTVSLVPPAITTYAPDFAKIRTMVSTAISKAEGNGPAKTGRHRLRHTDNTAANDASNLTNAC
ncbi:MAG: LCP family protein [Nocardioidaceae bacterium]